MKFDRVSLWAIIGFLVLVFSYDRFLKRKYGHLNQPHAQTQITTPSLTPIGDPPEPISPPTTDPLPSRSAPARQPLTAQGVAAADRVFENSDVLWEIDPTTGGFSRVELKQFQISTKDDSHDSNSSMAPRVNMVSDRLWIQPLMSAERLDEKPYQVQISHNQATFSRMTGDMKITHSYEFPDSGYHLRWSVRVDNQSPSPKPLMIYLSMADEIQPLPSAGSFFLPGMPLNRPSLVAITDSSQERFDTEKSCEQTSKSGLITKSSLSLIEVLGFDRYHFITALMPSEKEAADSALRGTYSLYKQHLSPSGHCQFSWFLGQNFGSINSGSHVLIHTMLFFGPKDYRITETIHPKLKETIDLGWFAFLAHPLLYVLHFFYDLVGNYGIAIILLTILLKMLFFPLTRAAALSMNRTRIYQPELNAIRERYKSDMAKQQRETMAFMSKHKINPMKGCLPILPQMPVFIALYRVLSTAVELRQAPFMGWLQDLSAPDPYFITPAVLAGCMWLQQKLTPQMGTDDLQRKMMMWMPVIFAAMMVGFPSGMVLYMLANTLVSMAQQQYFNALFKKSHGATS